MPAENTRDPTLRMLHEANDNTWGQVGDLGSSSLRRGLPHRFAQVRSVVAVAAHRCDQTSELARLHEAVTASGTAEHIQKAEKGEARA